MIVVATVTRGDVRMEYMMSMFDAMIDHAIDRIILQAGGHYLDDARNQCVEKYLTDFSEADWLLFIDDDQTFTAADITNLFANAQPHHRVVCGWYLSTIQRIVNPCTFYWGSHPQFESHYLCYTADKLRSLPRDEWGYVDVDATGTGFMGIRTSLLREMWDTYPLPTSPFAEEIINKVHCGEDLTFCHRVQQLGDRIYVNPDVHVGHIKSMELKEQ